MTDSLFTLLSEYGEGEVYPYHMPGHKRNGIAGLPVEFSKIDITEIDGFDNMHYPEGILLEAQQRVAGFYGTKRSFFLVNGSTVGNLAAISACLKKREKILVARNCHKSVYHGIYLRELQPVYLCPDINEKFDFAEPVTPKQVAEALEKDSEIRAVLIVSPTYEGRIAEVRAIAEIVHSRGIPLIVDEAHGAHLGIHPAYAESSVQAGADVVIQSLHKTLPSLTQTALLHLNGELVKEEQIEKYLRIYQSSSPSYIFMASMDSCIREMQGQGKDLLEKLYRNWKSMHEKLQVCKVLSFPKVDEKQDIGKLVISVKNSSISGVELSEILLKKYRLQLEMACDTYALAMFTVGDTEEGYERLTKALLEIDNHLSQSLGEGRNKPETPREKDIENRLAEMESKQIVKSIGKTEESQEVPVWQAFDAEYTEVSLEDAEGKIAADFVSVYPPGIPLLVPGERITQEIINEIHHDLKRRLSVQGVKEEQGRELVRIIKR